MTLGLPIDPGLIEVLTGSAFGFQRIGHMPLFDPPGWNPDTGVDQALSLMGVRSERETFADADTAMARLAQLASVGPVFVGPLEMGLLRHQPGSDRPTGADHFVAVLDVTANAVIMHDPQGFPYARLSRSDFTAAWGSDSIGYAEGRFPLRTGFTVPRGEPGQWLKNLLGPALDWAEGKHALTWQDAGNAGGLRALAEEAEKGLPDPMPMVLCEFALRVGARRRADAAVYLKDRTELAGELRQQAEILGAAQLCAVVGDDHGLAAALRRAADAHERATEALRGA